MDDGQFSYITNMGVKTPPSVLHTLRRGTNKKGEISGVKQFTPT